MYLIHYVFCYIKSQIDVQNRIFIDTMLLVIKDTQLGVKVSEMYRNLGVGRQVQSWMQVAMANASTVCAPNTTAL